MKSVNSKLTHMTDNLAEVLKTDENFNDFVNNALTVGLTVTKRQLENKKKFYTDLAMMFQRQASPLQDGDNVSQLTYDFTKHFLLNKDIKNFILLLTVQNIFYSSISLNLSANYFGEIGAQSLFNFMTHNKRPRDMRLTLHSQNYNFRRKSITTSAKATATTKMKKSIAAYTLTSKALTTLLSILSSRPAHRDYN